MPRRCIRQNLSLRFLGWRRKEGRGAKWSVMAEEQSAGCGWGWGPLSWPRGNIVGARVCAEGKTGQVDRQDASPMSSQQNNSVLPFCIWFCWRRIPG